MWECVCLVLGDFLGEELVYFGELGDLRLGGRVVE